MIWCLALLLGALPWKNGALAERDEVQLLQLRGNSTETVNVPAQLRC